MQLQALFPVSAGADAGQRCRRRDRRPSRSWGNNRKTIFQLNKYKNNITVLQKKFENQGVYIRVLRSGFGHAEEERDMVRLKNEGIRTNEDLTEMVTYGSKKMAKKCIDALSYSLSGKYIGAAWTVKQKICGRARKVFSELNLERKVPRRLWTGLVEGLTENGILSHSGVRIIPKCPIFVQVCRILQFFINDLMSILEHVSRVS